MNLDLTQKYLTDLDNLLSVSSSRLPKDTEPRTGNKESVLDLENPGDDPVAATSLISALRLRASSRTFSAHQKRISAAHLSLLLSHGLRERASQNQTIKYPTPVAGGTRELRYILFCRNIVGLARGIYEYDPLHHALVPLPSNHIDLDAPFFEKWEFESSISFVACFNPTNPKRNYVNNLLHVAFEAGAVIQTLQLILTSFKTPSCIGGYIERTEFEDVMGSTSLYPLYALSIY